MQSEPPCLATGLVLAKRVAGLIPQLIDGQIPREAGQNLTKAITLAEQKAQRRKALSLAVESLKHKNPRLSRHQISRKLNAELLRFQRAKRRIAGGYRQPSEWEMLMQTISETGAICWRSLFDEIKTF